MELVRLTKDNLDTEHICCAISNNKDVQVVSKKAWLSKRFDEGLVFLKANVRGKCFIEYIPAECAWAPVDAAGYMYINCLWVSGQLQGHGYSSLLLDECIRDSREKGRKGLVMLSSKKKQGFLSDPRYARHKGFLLADEAAPYFELLYLPFDETAEKPCFRDCVRENHDNMQGFKVYYSDGCPYTAKDVPILAEIAKSHGAPLEVIHIENAEQAQRNPSPFTNFSLFYNGVFLTQEILSEKKFEKLLSEKGY